MEIESRTDALSLTLTRERAVALADVSALGLRVIEELELVQRPAATEHAINQLRQQIAKSRGKTVTIALTRGDGRSARYGGRCFTSAIQSDTHSYSEYELSLDHMSGY